MSKVYLFVEIEVTDGKLDGFTSALTKHAAYIRTEDGCETLLLFVDTKVANRVCVWEVWRDRIFLPQWKRIKGSDSANSLLTRQKNPMGLRAT
jgi:quinol monooxygenase YgiN